MRNRTSLLLELRDSLIQEHLRDGKPPEWAEKLATDDIRAHDHLLRKRAVLRLAVQQCKLQA